MIDSVKNATAHGYNSSNELTSADATGFTYDQNGNTLTKNDTNGQTTYGWDFENRLTSVTLPNGGGVVTFKYDPFGRRIERSGPSGTTIYAYDGANGIEELSAAGAATARYVQGAGIDEPLAESSSSLNYFSSDGLGSITSLEDSTGTPEATFVYGAFGVLSSSSGSATSSYRYTAREFDQDTGLYYYRARYYDPIAGRFISSDPLEFEGEDVNFYAYVSNQAVTDIDAFGLQKNKYPTQGVLLGTRAKYRMDMHQEPEPNMHVYWPDGTETVVTARGGWALWHGGKPTVAAPKCYRANLRPVVNSFLERVSGRLLAIAQWIATPLEEYTEETNLNNRAKEHNRTPYQQFCAESQAAGNPEYYMSPAGLLPNPCRGGNSL